MQTCLADSRVRQGSTMPQTVEEVMAAAQERSKRAREAVARVLPKAKAQAAPVAENPKGLSRKGSSANI